MTKCPKSKECGRFLFGCDEFEDVRKICIAYGFKYFKKITQYQREFNARFPKEVKD